MTKKTKKLPQEVIDHWPEIFADIELEIIPIKYLHAVRVQFKDGKIWDIDIAKSKIKDKLGDIEKSLTELFTVYEQDIENIDFRLDTISLKKDIQSRTAKFIKKRK